MKRIFLGLSLPLFQLVLKDIVFSKRDIFASLAVLTLGLTALLLSFGFKESIESYIDANARKALTADIRVTRTQAFPDDLLEEIEQSLNWDTRRREIEFLANIRPVGAESSLLVSVHAVEADFPALGEIELEDAGSFGQLIEQNAAVTHPEIRDLLNLRIGDQIQLGNLELPFQAVVKNDPGIIGFGTGFTPRVYIPFDQALQTGLIQFGSQVQFHHYYTLSDPSQVAAEVERLTAMQRQDGSSVVSFSIRSADRALANIERGLGFFQSLLSLLSLTIAVFSFMIGFYLIQIFAQTRAQQWAIYLIFGARPAQIQWLGWLQSGLLLVSSWAGASLFSFFLLKWIQVSGGGFLPSEFNLQLGTESLLSGLIVALVAASLFHLPTALKLSKIRAKSLLEQDNPSLPELKPWSRVWPYLLASLSFFALTTYLFQNYLVAILFAGILLVNAIMALSLVPWLFRRAAQALEKTPTWSMARLAFLNLSRARFVTTLCFMALLKAGFIVGFIPHLYENAVLKELATPDLNELPDYFLINIPEEETPRLEEFLSGHQAELKHLSPFILARLLSINGEPSDQDIFRRFPTRVSYRSELLESERVIKGPELPADYDPDRDPIPLLSVEAQYARRSGMKIGDLLEFEISGFKIQGLIANLRQVAWNSFQPNFFIQFQRGILEDFPKTFIAVVYEDRPQVAAELQAQGPTLAYLIHQNFPNLSLINVSQTVSRLAEVTRSLGPPLQMLSLSTVGSAFFLVLALVFHNLLQRREERSLLSRLGASRPRMRKVFSWEYLSLGGFALILGLVTGTVGSYFVGHRYLQADFPWTPSFFGVSVAFALMFFLWLLVVFRTCES